MTAISPAREAPVLVLEDWEVRIGKGAWVADWPRYDLGMRMVLLLHELPDGSAHFDWMIQRPQAGRGLITFRVSARIDLLEQGSFRAQRLADHREVYLSVEGPVSGGRGTVTRLAQGEATLVQEGDGTLNVAGLLGVAGQWRGQSDKEGWVFRFMGRSTPRNANP